MDTKIPGNFASWIVGFLAINKLAQVRIVFFRFYLSRYNCHYHEMITSQLTYTVEVN